VTELGRGSIRHCRGAGSLTFKILRTRGAATHNLARAWPLHASCRPPHVPCETLWLAAFRMNCPQPDWHCKPFLNTSRARCLADLRGRAKTATVAGNRRTFTPPLDACICRTAPAIPLSTATRRRGHGRLGCARGGTTELCLVRHQAARGVSFDAGGGGASARATSSSVARAPQGL